MRRIRNWFFVVGLPFAVPLAGQSSTGPRDFGDDSSRWANDGACDDTRFDGDRGFDAWTANDERVGRDATDCRNLLNAGRIQWREATDAGLQERRRARFELFTECAAVFPIVYVQGDDAQDFGLTEERVRTMAESRLRVARLYGDGTSLSDMPLDVSIHTLDGASAYMISLKISKFSLYDPASGERSFAITWQQNALGQHGRDANSIMQGLSEMLDAFILDYLRVNEEACQ